VSEGDMCGQTWTGDDRPSCSECANLDGRERPRFWRWSAWVSFYATTGDRPRDGTVRHSHVIHSSPVKSLMRRLGRLSPTSPD
jgi:hypothetical protein